MPEFEVFINSCDTYSCNDWNWILSPEFGDDFSESLIAQKKSVQRWYLSYYARVFQARFNTRNDIVYILPVLHEPETSGECDSPNDVEGVPLAPRAKVYHLSLQVQHRVAEDFAAGVYHAFKCP